MLQHYLELLAYYRRMVRRIFIGVVGGVALFSAFFLFISPLYTATAKVSLLPTDSELAFTQNFVRGASVNPANLMSQTHIENLLSLEVARETVDRMIAELGSPQSSGATGIRARVASGFRALRNMIRRTYNILNSGKHVPLDEYTDTVLTLQDSIAAEMIEGTYILEISVTWDSPVVATAAANDLAQVYVERARKQAEEAALQLEQDLMAELGRSQGSTVDIERQIEALRLARATGFNVLRVVDPAVVPIYPSFPKVVINTLLALAAAIALSIFALVTADTFSGTVKTRADLMRIMGGNSLPSLGLRRQPSSAQRAEIGRLIRLRNDLSLERGAVLSMGSDADADHVAKVVNDILGPAQVMGLVMEPHGRSPAPAMAERTARGSTLVLAMADRIGGPVLGKEAVVPHGATVSRPRRRISATQIRVGSSAVSLGGGNESFSMAGQPAPAWLILALRPGVIAEADLQATVRDWTARGVANVYGVMLTG
ncbi:MAG: hypothetical protein R3D63_13345 [Paracoccaceae bacterium]